MEKRVKSTQQASGLGCSLDNVLHNFPVQPVDRRLVSRRVADLHPLGAVKVTGVAELGDGGVGGAREAQGG